MFIPSQLSKLYKDKDCVNYTEDNVPNYIETHEDTLLFLHSWMNPATAQKMKLLTSSTGVGSFLGGGFTHSVGMSNLKKSDGGAGAWNKVYFG